MERTFFCFSLDHLSSVSTRKATKPFNECFHGIKITLLQWLYQFYFVFLLWSVFGFIFWAPRLASVLRILIVLCFVILTIIFSEICWALLNYYCYLEHNISNCLHSCTSLCYIAPLRLVVPLLPESLIFYFWRLSSLLHILGLSTLFLVQFSFYWGTSLLKFTPGSKQF